MMQDLNTTEFAKLTRKHPATIRALIRNGKLKGMAYRIGGTWRSRRDAVDQLRGVPGIEHQGEAQ